MRKNKYRGLRRTLRVEPQKAGARRARPMTRSIARTTPTIQRYSYQISLRRLALKLRAMSGRLRRMETQLARGYKTMSGTKEEMENADNIGGGLLWWATDESVLYVHDDTGWQLSKATQSGTTVERLAYTPIFTGEIWWDTTLEQLFICNGSAWDDVAVAHSGTTTERDAYSQDVGDLWLDTTEREWYSDIGNDWQVMNPSLMDSFNRFPGLWELPTPSGLWWGESGGGGGWDDGYINATPYTRSGGAYDGILALAETLVFYCWVRPLYASITGRPWYGQFEDYSRFVSRLQKWDWIEDDDLCFALEQQGDKFLFGITTDGVRDNMLYAETPSIANANESWHFLVGIYDPSTSIRIYHNGTWYEYGGVVPATRWHGGGSPPCQKCSTVYSGGYSHWAVHGTSQTIPSNEIVDRVYERTRGLFS